MEMYDVSIVDWSTPEAKRNAEDCLTWLPICQAECCWLVSFQVDQPEVYVVGDNLSFIEKDFSMKWYHELHGAKVRRNKVTYIIKEIYKQEGEWLIIKARCSKLTSDLRCSGHPNRKPRICRELTPESLGGKDFFLTSRCRFRYLNGGCELCKGRNS